jgi:hypothetical protein
MKKYLIILLLTAGVPQLKAQQITIKPSSPAFNKVPDDGSLQQFSLREGSLFKAPWAFPKSAPLAALPGIDAKDKHAEVFYSRMPVAQLRSDDKMPVAKLESMDKMPVKRIEIVDPLAKLSRPMP